jgi:prophage maintenance system killer protein
MLTRTETNPAFDLNELKEFNRAIVYGFEPESSPEALFETDTLCNRLLPEAPQYQDMLNAYLYAQNVLLPAFRGMEEKPIESGWFLDQLNVLHGKIAKTLYSNLNLTAGEYTNNYVLRWHAGYIIVYDIMNLMNDHKTPTKDQIIALAEHYGLNFIDLQNFIRLTHDLRNDSTIPLPTDEETLTADHPGYTWIPFERKLCIAYHTGRFTKEEKNIVDKIVTICQPPETIPASMTVYAHNTLEKLLACDRENLDEVALFLAESFFHLTEIHPYSNGNGRLATCVMNIFLRYFNQPSILLRLPGENSDASSLYSRAIKEIRATQAPLAELIKQRILDISSLGAFADEELKTIASLRVTLSERIQELLRIQPGFDVEGLYNEGIMPRLASVIIAKEDEENKKAISCLQEMLRLVNAYIVRYREKLSSAAMTAAGFSLVERKFTAEEKPQILSALNDFAKLSNWKLNITAGAFWTESEDHDAATALLEKLRERGAKELTVSKRKDNAKIWVVMCKDITFARRLLPHEAAATAAYGAGAGAAVSTAPC